MFYDRLVDDDDRKWLYGRVRDLSKTHLGIEFNTLFENLDSNGDGKVEEDDMRSLMFCDFTDPKADPRQYVEVVDLNKLRGVVESYLEEFNLMSKKPMNLVLFRYSNTSIKRTFY